ncbi:MAG: hypothetical protein EZS28_028640 [Streblomastix strix]|uniref:Uncharacterized protein n=1 Tax=Streblomastix strix TaxID=222440 RepID=A0A5J4V000_9EUKA|nr:MAG: hypothetical protein EZS28_028640 [Streblomastix strix]
MCENRKAVVRDFPTIIKETPLFHLSLFPRQEGFCCKEYQLSSSLFHHRLSESHVLEVHEALLEQPIKTIAVKW